jgi:rRNA maturation protein Nop10
MQFMDGNHTCVLCDVATVQTAEPLVDQGARYTLYTCSVCGTMTQDRAPPERPSDAPVGEYRREFATMSARLEPPIA